MRYGLFDPYGPKTYGACISLLHQGTMRYNQDKHALYKFNGAGVLDNPQNG